MPIILTVLVFLFAGAAHAQTITIGLVYQLPVDQALPSPLFARPKDEGVAGARVALAENNSTGKFLGLRFALREAVAAPQADAASELRALAGEGLRIFVLSLDAEGTARAIAAAPPGAILINAGATDDALRAASCRQNLLHVSPSRAMLADALAQYLVLKRWRRWMLLVGPDPQDIRYADAIRRAARRFGASIVAEKNWTMRFGAGRADTGHVTLQSEIPVLTQGPDHDVLIVADETNLFGDYLEGRTALPRPVAGTHGLVATAFSPATDAFGASQLHARMERMSGRRMTDRDYGAWAAVRAVGEAALRIRSAEPASILDAMCDPGFSLGGFKGQAQSFRFWDGQMRQPVLIVNARMLVSVSPQPGFLHRFSDLDSLGVDEQESPCKS